MTLTLVIPGAPRTKKNHGRIIWRKVKGVSRKFHVPSEAYSLWCQAVVLRLAKYDQLPDQPYNIAALFYREAATGDAAGYYQGLADALEAAGLVSDDKYLVSWDGSRLLVDRAQPRVELSISIA